MKLWKLVVATAAGVAAVAPIGAMAYPERPVRMVVAFAPGGSTDVVARMMAQKLQDRWPHPMVVENRGGAGTIIATDLVAKAAPDGHTLLFTSAAFAINPSIRKSLPYDSLRDLAPVAQAIRSSHLLVVHPSVQATNMKELLALAKANPGKLSFGSSGIGASNHLAGELLKLKAGVNLTHVPFRGTGDAMTSLLSGEISMLFDSMVSGLTQTRAGNLRAIAVGTLNRDPAVPDVQAISETVEGFDVDSWLGIFAPAGISKDLLSKVHAELSWALTQPDVKAKLADLGTTVVASQPEDFRKHIEKEMATWATVIQAAGIERQ